jgi:hypothetical protein
MSPVLAIKTGNLDFLINIYIWMLSVQSIENTEFMKQNVSAVRCADNFLTLAIRLWSNSSGLSTERWFPELKALHLSQNFSAQRIFTKRILPCNCHWYQEMEHDQHLRSPFGAFPVTTFPTKLASSRYVHYQTILPGFGLI